MKAITWTAAIILVVGFIVIVQFDKIGDQGKRQEQILLQENEKKTKMMTVEQDVRLTQELTMSHYLLDIEKLVRDLDTVPAANTEHNIHRYMTQHPKVACIIQSTPHNSWTVYGTELKGHSVEIQQAIEQAKQAVAAGKPYQTSMHSEQAGSMLVLGFPKNNGQQGGLVSVVRQDIISRVEAESRRNMRLTIYPNPNQKSGMKAATANNLEELKVKNPEQNQGKTHYYKNEIVVKFKKQPTEAELKRIKSDLNNPNVEKLGNTFLFTTKKMDTKRLIRYFKKHNIDFVEPHYLYTTNESTIDVPNDTLYSRYQWNLPLINAESGWALSKGSNDVIIAVVDTGVNLNHPDLSDRLIEGYNAVDTSKAPEDDVGHGTHVAGIIAATVNNNLGIAGLTWNNPIMPVKVLDSSGAGNAYNVAEGIIWATDHGAKVINLSLGNYAQSDFLHDAVQYAYNHDVVLVAASGNDNSGQPGFPAAYPEVLAIAATDSNNNKASFSNYGNYIDVAAPGVNIASTYVNSEYASLSGTSMASPHVAALAGLIRSTNPTLTNKEVMDIMRDSAIDIHSSGKDDYTGFGEIDVSRALQLAQGEELSGQVVPTNESALENNSWNTSFARFLSRLFRAY